jgi:hypothetical protein
VRNAGMQCAKKWAAKTVNGGWWVRLAIRRF